MNRREALQRAAWLMGGTLSAPALLGVLNECIAKDVASPTPAFLTQPQIDLVTTVVDIMIPRTATPGATDVGVPTFIDTMLKHVYSPEDRARYLVGLAEFDAAARKAHGKFFTELNVLQQSTQVHTFHDEAVAEERRLEQPDNAPIARPFILITKELTLVGFFTSHVGATQVLQYDAIPGAFRACVPLSEAGNGKTWATEPGIRL